MYVIDLISVLRDSENKKLNSKKSQIKGERRGMNSHLRSSERMVKGLLSSPHSYECL